MIAYARLKLLWTAMAGFVYDMYDIMMWGGRIQEPIQQRLTRNAYVAKSTMKERKSRARLATRTCTSNTT
jgi:hypothetical protein